MLKPDLRKLKTLTEAETTKAKGRDYHQSEIETANWDKMMSYSFLLESLVPTSLQITQLDSSLPYD